MPVGGKRRLGSADQHRRHRPGRERHGQPQRRRVVHAAASSAVHDAPARRRTSPTPRPAAPRSGSRWIASATSRCGTTRRSTTSTPTTTSTTSTSPGARPADACSSASGAKGSSSTSAETFDLINLNPLGSENGRDERPRRQERHDDRARGADQLPDGRRSDHRRLDDGEPRQRHASIWRRDWRGDGPLPERSALEPAAEPELRADAGLRRAGCRRITRRRRANSGSSSTASRRPRRPATAAPPDSPVEPAAVVELRADAGLPGLGAAQPSAGAQRGRRPRRRRRPDSSRRCRASVIRWSTRSSSA